MLAALAHRRGDVIDRTDWVGVGTAIGGLALIAFSLTGGTTAAARPGIGALTLSFAQLPSSKVSRAMRFATYSKLPGQSRRNVSSYARPARATNASGASSLSRASSGSTFRCS